MFNFDEWAAEFGTTPDEWFLQDFGRVGIHWSGFFREVGKSTKEEFDKFLLRLSDEEKERRKKMMREMNESYALYRDRGEKFVKIWEQEKGRLDAPSITLTI